MKNINRYKRIIILLIFVLLVMAFTRVDASEYTSGVEIGEGGKEIFKEPGNIIFGIVKVVGTFASVIALMIIGIKYMLGSVEEKAEYKKTFWIYAIGAILIFGVSNLAEWAFEAIKTIK